MPDAANRDDMPPGEAGWRHRLRLCLFRVPLALPLLGVLAALLGGGFWAVLVVAAALAALLRLWRIMLCTLLCAMIAGVHVASLRHDAALVQQEWAQHDAVNVEGRVVSLLGRGCLLKPVGLGVTVALRGEELPFAEGDCVRVLAAPREVEPPPVRGMFDRASWMRSQGIAAEADFIRGERTDAPMSWALLRGYATGIRHALSERLMPPGTEDDPRRQVLCALVLGARELAEPGTMLPFRRGGCLHAFAVSGMHVVMLAGILWAVLRALRVRPVVGRWLQLLVLGVYVVVTGFAVPAVRAYVMMATLLLGLSLRRRVGLANSWCFAALLVLLVEPWQLYSAGFLLSFAIYAAICAGARICLREPSWFGPDDLIPPRIYTAWEQKRRQGDYALRGVVVVALTAWVVSLPLTCWLFHTITPWSFVTNIVIAPVIPLVMMGGIVLLCVGGLPVLGPAATWCALHAAGLLISLASWLGYLPGAYLPAEWPRPPQAAMVLGTGYGGSVCVLGNPGLVIDCGNELTAALQVEPALFHSGFRPAALLVSQPVKSHGGGAEVLRATWPGMQLLQGEELGQKPLVLEGRAGRYTLYPAPPELRRRPAANMAPIVRWERPDGRSLLYIGDAARATFERLPEEARRADVVILGSHPHQPLDDPMMLQLSGAGLILLLPSAADSLLHAGVLPPEVRLLRMGVRQLVPLH